MDGKSTSEKDDDDQCHGPPLLLPSCSMENLSDPLLMHIMEMVGMAPELSWQAGLGSSWSFRSDVVSMALVCQRWNKMVRSNDEIWSSLCQWRWPWIAHRDMPEVEVELSHNLRLSEEEQQPQREVSRWRDLCLRPDRCLLAAGKQRRNNFWHEDYTMLVEVYATMGGERVLSAGGTLRMTDIGTNANANDVWSARAGWDSEGDGAWGSFTWWRTGDTTPLQVLMGRVGHRMTVEVMLLNKKTMKMALWLAMDSRFMGDPAHDGEPFLQGNHFTIVTSGGITFRHGKSLSVYVYAIRGDRDK